MRTLVPTLLFAAALVAVGLAVPRFLISDGLARFRGDPHRFSVAVRAYEAAWVLNDHPLVRLALPVARVEEVRHDPGHCPPGEPGSAEANADYTARVRFYSLFALPGPSVRVTCGGWAWIWSSAA